MSYLSDTLHIPKFGDDIWYVNKGSGSNSNSGKTPDTALETIKAGIAAMSSGDALNIAAGTYTELNLNLNCNSCEMWCERGTLIDPASNTGLIVSGDSCEINGSLRITPDSAAVGLLVSGNECEINGIKIVGGTDCFQLTGLGTIARNCLSGFPAAAGSGYSITGAQTGLYDCGTVGDTTSYGFKVTGSNTGILRDCESKGHQTSGFYLDTGTSNWSLVNCSTGGGDGKWIDVDDANVWSNFTYPETKYKEITFSTDSEYNLFQVKGAVEILQIYGHVTTILVGTNTDVFFDLWTAGGGAPAQEDITLDNGADMAAAAAGSLAMKTEDPNKVVTLFDAGTPTVDKGVDPKKRGIVVNADVDYDTFIRWNVTGSQVGGKMHFHVIWVPLDEVGFVEPA